MSDYLCQKSVTLDAVLKKHKSAVMQRLGEYEVQKKYDGCQAVFKFFNDHNGALDEVVSRTGEENIALRPALRQLQGDLMELIEKFNGIVVFAEAYKTGQEFRNISGNFRRQKEDDTFEVIVFDMIPMDDFNRGHSDLTYMYRIDQVFGCDLRTQVSGRRWSTVVHEGVVNELVLSAVDSPSFEQDLVKLANTFVAQGGLDGVILRDQTAGWDVGDGKNGVSIKVKPLLSLDLKVVGYEMGKGKLEGMIGKLVVKYKGKRVGVGTGLTNEERAMNYQNTYHDKIIQVDCMGVTPDGSLREPRYIGVRHDKVKPD